MAAALKAVHVSNVLHHPGIDNVCENASFTLYSTPQLISKDKDYGLSSSLKTPKFALIGHRGNGMNKMTSPDPRMKAVKENSLLSFNAAAAFNIDFVEFDVQVTKDDIPVIFHDDFILTKENDMVSERKVTDMTLAEFLRYGPQRETGHMGKSLFRKAADGRIYNWMVENDDSVCTLQEAFQKVDSSVGFNMELKFDDDFEYQEQEIVPVLQVILQVVFEHAKGRPIVFSTFQPDAARLIRKMQDTYPVFFLTDGGVDLYKDARRNSLDEAMKLCLANGLQGIVSEAKAIFRNPGEITRIKESNLSLLTYGQLNNVPEAVYMQHLMGIDGVIVDYVKDIVETVSDITKPVEDIKEEKEQKNTRPKFSELELSFLLKLIPELVQQR
ncbi:glycerophosphodiester phosphodiesterase [Ranunculus cassubicifolius]